MFSAARIGVMTSKMPPPWTPPNPYTINLIRNDLDFVYSNTIQDTGAYKARLEFSITFDDFFSAGGDHIAFGVNARTPNTVHCGPIVRNGLEYFGTGRGGYIKAGTDQVYVEAWNNTSSPYTQLMTRTGGTGFNTTSNPNVTIRLDCNYTDHPTFPDRTDIYIYDNTGGSTLFAASIVNTAMGSIHTATSVAFVGGIANGFISPNSTGCVETTASGSAPNASATISNISHIIF